MSTLTNIEKVKLESMFKSPAGAGYVMDFSNPAFHDFIFTSTKKDIANDTYATYGESKAKRLRAFWEIESDSIVGKLTAEMLEYWKTKKQINQEAIADYEKALFKECEIIVARLSGRPAPASAAAKEITEDDFIKTEFKNVSLTKINLDGSLIGILEQRIEEIRKCLSVKAPLSVIFLCGSTLEGLLLGVASNRHKDFNLAKASPKDKASGQPLPFPKWTLANFIDVSHELGIVGEDVKKFSHALRDFRNYIHPYQQMASGFNPSLHTAEICWKVLQAAISEISGNK